MQPEWMPILMLPCLALMKVGSSQTEPEEAHTLKWNSSSHSGLSPHTTTTPLLALACCRGIYEGNILLSKTSICFTGLLVVANSTLPAHFCLLFT